MKTPFTSRTKRYANWAALTAGILAGSWAADANLVAHYTFDEGAGEQLQDHSGNGHHGRIVNADWVKDDAGGALRFGRTASYVDFGDNRALKPTSDFTVLAWVKVDPPAYPDHDTNWTVFDSESYPEEGTILRIDGAQSQLLFRSSRAGKPFYRVGRAKLARGGRYLVGVVRRGDSGVLVLDGVGDGGFATGGDPIHGTVPFKISSTGQSLAGLMYDFKMYDHALSTSEIVAEYWAGAARFGKDTSAQGNLILRPHIYDEEAEAVAVLEVFGILPVGGERILEVALERSIDGSVISREQIDDIPSSCRMERSFSLAGEAPGRYALAARVRGGGRGESVVRAEFDWPKPGMTVPSPGDRAVPPLPPGRERRVPRVRTAPGGGFRIQHGSSDWLAVDSTFSVPHAAALRLGADNDVEEGCVSSGYNQVTVETSHYRIKRSLEALPGRVVVRDRLTNPGGEPVGVLLSHRARVADVPWKDPMICGYQVAPPLKRRIRTNPTVFATADGRGFGLVALDDVLIIQGQGGCDDHGISLGSDEFALGPGASYTMEWAVYLVPSGDYYDLVNDIRVDEGRNHTTVEGSWAGVPGSQRRRAASVVPGPDYFQRRNVKYANIACLSWCTDDPSISLEGIEFIEYPAERAAVRETVDAVKAVHPGAKVMFHIAPNLYATGNPGELWPDSHITDVDGKQTVYNYNYQGGRYFSQERLDAGWRWWSYYPAVDNSYGQAMLDSVDVMMDEMGCTGVFIDGFLWDYGGAYSYNRFDGHTADIDPGTGAILRLKTAVPLLQQHAMAAYGRKIMSKGGVVVANNVLPTRTVASLPFIFDKEITEGPEMHLLPTPCTLGNPASIEDEQGLYRDVLGKLSVGNLYFFYGGPVDLKHEPLPARMYPITVTEVRPYLVIGRERLVTGRTGDYGWPRDRALHKVYRFDSRGRRSRHAFFSTADADSVRTRIELGVREAAVVERLPVVIETENPVNLAVEEMAQDRITVIMNGEGPVTLIGPMGHIGVRLSGTQRVEIDLGGPAREVARGPRAPLPAVRE